MENVLVVVDGVATVSGSGDDTGTATREETLEDLDTDTSFAYTGEQGGLFGVGDARGGDLGQHVEVCCQRRKSEHSQMLVNF